MSQRLVSIPTVSIPVVHQLNFSPRSLCRSVQSRTLWNRSPRRGLDNDLCRHFTASTRNCRPIDVSIRPAPQVRRQPPSVLRRLVPAPLSSSTATYADIGIRCRGTGWRRLLLRRRCTPATPLSRPRERARPLPSTEPKQTTRLSLGSTIRTPKGWSFMVPPRHQ